MNENIQNPSATSSASGALLTGAALAGGALLLSNKKASAQTQNKPTLTFATSINGTGDAKVLNYALALEALEADLYVQALQRLTNGGTNGLGQTITGLKAQNNSAAADVIEYLTDFGKVEAAHRDFLSGALGSSAITATGNPLANAKFDFGFSNNTTTIDDVIAVVQGAEALGVMAYIGAIPFFATTTYLSTAAAIQGTEARHTAVITAIRNKFSNRTDPVAPLSTTNNGIDQPKTPDAVLATVSGPNGYIVFPTAN